MAAIQTDADVQNWFNKDRCKVLHLGKNKPFQ